MKGRKWIIVAALWGWMIVVPLSAKADDDTEWHRITEATETPAISEAPLRYLLEGIFVRGAGRTIEQVIHRQIALAVGERFSVEDDRLNIIRFRLLATGLFSEVSVSLSRGTGPGRVYLLIAVIERNTLVIRDLNFGLTRIAPHWDTIVPFGSVGLEERSFLGTGVAMGGAIAASPDQIAYQIYLSDRHFLNSRFGLHVEGLFVQSQEYFGDHYLPGPDEETTFGRYEKLDYRRAGIRLGSGYHLVTDFFFWADYRLENILTEQPQTIEGTIYQDPDQNEPIIIGYLEPDASILSGVQFGFLRDTTNHSMLPWFGSRTELAITLSSPVMGSSYNFAKFVVHHRTWFPFGREGQSISVGGTAGIITGKAPFFEQFFVGDYSALVPERRLGLNFSNLHPEILKTAIVNMWYEDMVLHLAAEYAFPFYRGSRLVYGINGFLRFGVYSLTSADKMGEGSLPIDISGDLGIKMDTNVGVFSLSFTNVLQLIPPIRRETTR